MGPRESDADLLGPSPVSQPQAPTCHCFSWDWRARRSFACSPSLVCTPPCPLSLLPASCQVSRDPHSASSLCSAAGCELDKSRASQEMCCFLQLSPCQDLPRGPPLPIRTKALSKLSYGLIWRGDFSRGFPTLLPGAGGFSGSCSKRQWVENKHGLSQVRLELTSSSLSTAQGTH